jgi:hypothetical protein
MASTNYYETGYNTEHAGAATSGPAVTSGPNVPVGTPGVDRVALPVNPSGIPVVDISARTVENPALRRDAEKTAVANKISAEKHGASIKRSKIKTREEHAAAVKTGADRYEEIHKKTDEELAEEGAVQPNVAENLPYQGYSNGPSLPVGRGLHNSSH